MEQSSFDYNGLGQTAAQSSVSLAGSYVRGAWQNKWNRQAVERANRYNSPREQMARYSEAGLNPNLIYGQGSPGLQSAPVQQTAPEVDPAPTLGRHQQMAVEREQILNMRAQRDLLEAQKKSVEQGTTNANIAEMRMRSDVPYFGQISEANAAMKGQTWQRMMLDLELGRAKLTSAELDQQIKREVSRNKEYYNYQTQFGIEKGDPWYVRMATGAGRSLYPYAQRAMQWVKNRGK